MKTMNDINVKAVFDNDKYDFDGESAQIECMSNWTHEEVDSWLNGEFDYDCVELVKDFLTNSDHVAAGMSVNVWADNE